MPGSKQYRVMSINDDGSAMTTAASITSTGGFVGDVTGDITGDVTGDVTGLLNTITVAVSAGVPSGAGVANGLYLDTTNHDLYICTDAAGTYKLFTRAA